MAIQYINQKGKPAFVVVPIREWRRIEAALEDYSDASVLREFLKNPSKTYSDKTLLRKLRIAEATGVSRRKLGDIARTIKQRLKTNPAA